MQAIFLSGRYRTERLCRFWSKNPDGYCLLQHCIDHRNIEDISHIFLHCQSLNAVRERLVKFTLDATSLIKVRELTDCILFYTQPQNPDFLQFMLDCSVLPPVISLAQQHGHYILEQCFKISRTWCFSLHRERMRQLGRWTFS